MCGICGIFHFEKSRTADDGLLVAMRDLMVHRGPDDAGHYIDGPIGLAHRRLSIIDLSTGHQPMFNEEGTVAIVYNGEVYNYIEIKNELIKKGHNFRTRSDTEVIIHAYEEFGEQCVEKFRGMFAFALWDKRNEKVLIVLDRLGIKPLFYTEVDGTLVFASEIKSILLYPGIERALDFESLDLYLSLRYVPGPLTMFHNIFKLLPGHMMVATPEGTEIRKYWDVEFTPSDTVLGETHLEEFREILEESIRIRLRSDVPLGVFLSGGVDSSSVVALMSQMVSAPIKTFSVGYPEKMADNEFDFARRVADRFHTDHHEFRLSPVDFLDFIPKLVWHLDEPVADSSTIPLYYISKLAREFVTVILSGEGADEILAGYYIYKKMLGIEKLRNLPLFPLVAGLMTLVRPLLRHQKLAKYAELIRHPIEERYLGVSSVFSDGAKKDLYAANENGLRDRSVHQFLQPYYEKTRHCDLLNRTLYLDLKVWLPDDLLMKADKMTMATSMELRVPFLDHRLVEFAATLPTEGKLQNGESKYILKKLMSAYLPESILFRKKKGFPVPIQRWFQSDLQKNLKETLLDSGSACLNFFKREQISRLIALHEAGRGDYSDHLWTLLVFEYWHKMFIEGTLTGGAHA